MTKAEQTLMILEAQKRFYAWEPPGSPFQSFRCHHQPSCMIMSEERCRARAARPDIYREDCGGQARGRRCPRWKHYFKEANLVDKRTRKKLLDHLKPQPLRRAK